MNATGVLLHTNLGRAPLGDDAMAEAAVGGDVVLQPRVPTWTPATEARGTTHAGWLLARACGAEAGIVVNNNAAAVLLALGRAGARP